MNSVSDILVSDERGVVFACPHCGKQNRMNYEALGRTFRCGQCHQDLPPPGEPVDVQGEPAFDALVSRSAVPVLADFWAPWCGPCKMVAPELAKVAADGAGRWLVAKVNTEDLPALTQRFQVSAIPTLVLFRGGHELARQAGAMAAPAIRRFVEQATA